MEVLFLDHSPLSFDCMVLWRERGMDFLFWDHSPLSFDCMVLWERDRDGCLVLVPLTIVI